MGKRHVMEIRVEWGDCDPGMIVFHPNMFRWFDFASHRFFFDAGVAPWHELEKTRGIMGTPIVSTTCDFKATCTYGETIHVETTIEEWRRSSFVMKHVLRRGDVVLAEARGVRVFAARDPQDPRKIRAIPVPPDIRELCE